MAEHVTWTAWFSSLKESQLFVLLAAYLVTFTLIVVPTMSCIREILHKIF